MIHKVEPIETRSYIAPALHQKLKAAAEDSLRSMSAEIAFRLQKSFEYDEKVEATMA